MVTGKVLRVLSMWERCGEGKVPRDSHEPRTWPGEKVSGEGSESSPLQTAAQPLCGWLQWVLISVDLFWAADVSSAWVI